MSGNGIAPALRTGLIGGVLGGAISGLINYFVMPMPAGLLDQAFGHFISGGISGFLSGFIGLVTWIRAQQRSGQPAPG